MRIRKNDQVLVMTGKDKGKKGRVMQVNADKNTVLVEKINYKKVAARKTQANPKGGIVQMEKPLSASNVQLVCPRCSKPTRIGFSILADGEKQRTCKKCSEVLGAS